MAQGGEERSTALPAIPSGAVTAALLLIVSGFTDC